MRLHLISVPSNVYIYGLCMFASMGAGILSLLGFKKWTVFYLSKMAFHQETEYIENISFRLRRTSFPTES